MNCIWTPIAGILSGILASMGLGGGGILIIYLTIFAGIEQATAQGINLVFFIPISIVAILIYYKKKLISWKTSAIASIFGILGAVSGSLLSTVIDSSLLSKIFGLLLFIIGLNQLFSKKNTKYEK